MKIITAKAAILAIAVIIGVGLLPSCMFTHNGKEINEVRTVDMSGIKSVKIKATSAEVYIIPTTETVARVSLTGKSSSDKILFSVALIENKLVVECDEKWSTFSDLTVRIEIPSSKNYDSIDTKVVSGKIGISGLQASEVLLKSISGKITATNIKGSVDAKTTSGKLKSSGETLLGYSYELDEAPSFERFIFLSANSEISLSALNKAFAEAKNSSDLLELDPASYVPQDCRVAEIVLLKEQ